MQNTYCDWEDENWDTLIYSLHQKNCILMLGPDAATEEFNGRNRPLTEALSNELAEKIEPEFKKELNPFDLAQVAQQYCMEKGRLDLEARVSVFFNARLNQTSDLHKNFAVLPFYFVVTTTPDNMFRNALRKEEKDPIEYGYNFNGANPDIVQMGTVEHPLLFYLYGTLSEPKSLPLTENDLLDFLVALISKKRPLPDNIRSELQNENIIFLFVGFGFRHWYLRILLHVLKGDNGRMSRSFAIERFTHENMVELRRNVFFFKRSDYKIHIFDYELNDFAKRLRDRYKKSSPECVPRSGIPHAPQVFICHANENKKYASFLYKKLEEAGLRLWLDRENLRGGDHWDKLIRKTVKEVDYFIVLQSKAMAKKQIGYVNREINIALDRQEEFRRSIRFIIPVKIEECQKLEELEHLQTIDLTEEANTKKLIATIKRDFERRTRH